MDESWENRTQGQGEIPLQSSSALYLGWEQGEKVPGSPRNKSVLGT